jgi:hypothetical protein
MKRMKKEDEEDKDAEINLQRICSDTILNKQAEGKMMN